MNNKGISKFTSKLEVTRVEPDKTYKTVITLAKEVPFTIIVNGTEICTLMCSPSGLKELTYGFLYSSSFISDLEDIVSLNINEKEKCINVEIKGNIKNKKLNKPIISLGGKGSRFSEINENTISAPVSLGFKIKKEKIIQVTEWFQNSSDVHKITGGVHSSSLSINGNKPDIMFEDVARHNSVDKVIGSALLKKNKLFRKYINMFVSCIFRDFKQSSTLQNSSYCIFKITHTSGDIVGKKNETHINRTGPRKPVYNLYLP